MLSERERHTLFGLYALESSTVYHLSAQPGSTPLRVQRGMQTFYITLEAMFRLNLDVLSGAGLQDLSVRPVRRCRLSAYAQHSEVQAAFDGSAVASAARHRLIGACLQRIFKAVQTAAGLSLIAPAPLDAACTELLRTHHGLPSGEYRLHLQRSSGHLHSAHYQITDAHGTGWPLTYEALSTLSIVHEGLIHLRGAGGQLSTAQPEQYRTSPHNHQPAVTGWALAHQRFAPLQAELRSRGAGQTGRGGSPQYALSVPLVVP